MQDNLELFEEAGIRVYGVSYDSQESLAEFSEAYGITYDLLSDPDSAVIRDFGILNTTISVDDPEMHPGTGKGFYGVPFPGVYVTDEHGVVSEKFFHRHYGTRESGGSIRDSALGEILVGHEAPAAELENDQIKVTAFLSDPTMRFETMSMLYVRLELADGLHIYGNPLPEGYIASVASIPPTKGLRVGEAIYPETAQRAFLELGVTLPVYEGVIDIGIPVTVNAEILNWTSQDKPDAIEVPVSVLYQACSESVCYTPKTEELRLVVPIEALVMPGTRR